MIEVYKQKVNFTTSLIQSHILDANQLWGCLCVTLLSIQIKN